MNKEKKTMIKNSSNAILEFQTNKTKLSLCCSNVWNQVKSSMILSKSIKSKKGTIRDESFQKASQVIGGRLRVLLQDYIETAVSLKRIYSSNSDYQKKEGIENVDETNSNMIVRGSMSKKSNGSNKIQKLLITEAYSLDKSPLNMTFNKDYSVKTSSNYHGGSQFTISNIDELKRVSINIS